MTLRALRRAADARDLDSPALTPTPKPEGNSPRGGYSGSMPYYARTLEQLRIKCGVHGEAAVNDAEWGAIYRWLLNSDYDGSRHLSNPHNVIETVTYMVREHDRARLNYPHHKGGKFRFALDDLSPESRAEALLVAAETRADWEKAGRPALTEKSLKTTQQYVQSVVARMAAGLIPHDTQENAV